MLVGELQSDSTAKGLAHNGCSVNAEDFKQITDPARERTKRVVPGGLLGLAVAHEVRRNHCEAIRESGNHVSPGARAARDAVEKEKRGPTAFHLVRHVVTVDRDVLELAFHGIIFPQRRNRNCVVGSDPSSGSNRRPGTGDREPATGD